MSNTDK